MAATMTINEVPRLQNGYTPTISTRVYIDIIDMKNAETKGIVPTMIDDAARAKIKTYPLRRGIGVLEGSGGNIAVLTGNDGKLLIDSGFTVSKARIVEALDNLSPDPIAQLINTHWHVDHTDGNAWIHSAGATIRAHENTKKHLSTSTRVEGWQYTFSPSPAGALPTTIFNEGGC